MVVKVHGSPLSGPTLRVVAAAHEKELDFEFVTVDFESGAHKQVPQLALNPYGQVPAFEDGDLQLFVMAIVEENEAKLAKVLDVYEARLSQTRYLGGETFTLADLHHLPQMNRLMSTRVKKLFDERPRVSAWLARPAWKKTVELAETSLRS